MQSSYETMLDLKRLQSFVTVAEETTLSRAAERLHISQPALSRRIQELEQDLGVRLFEPVGRGVGLTGQGEELLAHSRSLLAQAEALGDRARALGQGDVGVLRVGGSPQVLEHLIPGVLTAFGKAWPQIQVRLIEDGSLQMLQRLERGEVHLALTAYPPEQMFQSQVLSPVPVLAAVAVSHRLASQAEIEVTDLVEEPLLVLHHGFLTRETFDAACRLAHVRPRLFLESGAPHTALALAEAGLGIAIVPSTVRNTAKRLSLRRVLYEGKPLEMRLAVSWDPRRFLPPYAKPFIEEVAVQARERFTLPSSGDLGRQRKMPHAAAGASTRSSEPKRSTR